MFSSCERYRYTLWRQWSAGDRTCAFIGLNPSTATDDLDDPTIRRCVGYAQTWGFDRLLMLNLFAWRATLPAAMKRQKSVAVGPQNNAWIRQLALTSQLVVAAWGNHGKFRDRDAEVRGLLVKDGVRLTYLRLTGSGNPEHPLYLPKELVPVPWEEA